EFGVLLYYKFAEIPDLENLFRFYHSNCTSLSLFGRVRLSFHGVNVTIGGRMGALEKHIEALRSDTLFEGTDFKLASCFDPSNNRVAKECGFDSLSIRIVKELVTFSSHPLLKSPEISNAGKHLSAADFHSILQTAGKCQEVGAGYDNEVILLDARNLYETRIGKFHIPGVKTLDPKIRQYSDLPSWIDNNSDQLQGKNILMYCTGGIRCELASAYIRSKGPGFENVFQLYGGIQRYMEQFSGRGYFKGKNFVFDHRVSVGSSDSDVLGTCLLCGAPFDDYTLRCRCTHCRMLVLICNGCQESDETSSYVCELCRRNAEFPASISAPPDSNSAESINDAFRTAAVLPKSTCAGDGRSNAAPSRRKLRILCLHGFRQNASGFRGRTRSLAKKLKDVADLVFIDAPHELPFIYRPTGQQGDDSPPPVVGRKKFAWLVAKDHRGLSHDAGSSEWKPAADPFDPQQHRHQVAGLDVSVEHVRKAFAERGPFDGILGFSQGAAVAAAFAVSAKKGDLRFAILCSGFALRTTEKEESVVGEWGRAKCPSLHVFGYDRQIDCESSRELVGMFERESAAVVEHDMGHIIPTKSPYIHHIKLFLSQFI
ncbi:hypothetical protein M569_12213, partial [Genlisea aurea]